MYASEQVAQRRAEGKWWIRHRPQAAALATKQNSRAVDFGPTEELDLRRVWDERTAGLRGGIGLNYLLTYSAQADYGTELDWIGLT